MYPQSNSPKFYPDSIDSEGLGATAPFSVISHHDDNLKFDQSGTFTSTVPFFKRWGTAVGGGISSMNHHTFYKVLHLFIPVTYTHIITRPSNMTAASNDPSWWPLINSNINISYYIVASSAAVIYDWALTIEQEFELVWRHHWSLITVLYIGVRYIGMVYIVINMLQFLPTVSMTDEGCNVTYLTLNWMSGVANAMLGAIMITRLYAMYQKSRNLLIFLIIFFTAVTIACGVMIGMVNKHTVGEELILSGTYLCYCNDPEADAFILLLMTWILSTVWEVLALCLAVWIVVKHFRELQRSSTRWVIGDCFTVLMRTHVVYFASFVAVSCLDLGYLSPYFDSFTVAQNYDGIRQILSVVQLFVLGPRLILSVRQYYARVVDNSDTGTDMISMSFQERTHVSTCGGV